MSIRSTVMRMVLCGAFMVALCQVVVLGAVDYGNIQAPPGGKVDNVVGPIHQEFRWLAISEDTPVYSDPDCSAPAGTVGYLEDFYELWRDDTRVLLARGKRDPDGSVTDVKVVGYAKQSDLVVSSHNIYQCLRAQNRISRKALVVHRWREAADPNAGVRHKPDPSAKVVRQVNLFDILYVYALRGAEDSADGFCFVGTRPNCGVGDPELDSLFLGWLPNHRVFFWDHREAVEYNKSQEARRWRSDNDRPIRFFADKEDVTKGQVAIEEDLAKGQPWSYHVPRFPIISHTPEVIDGTPYLLLGVIGDSYSSSGRSQTRELEADIRRALEDMARGIRDLDVLFVIDATGSMGVYWRSIKESVGRIRAGLEQGRETPIFYGVLYYRDYTEGDRPNSFIQHFVDLAPGSVFANDFPHVGDGGGRDNPPPFYGIDTGLRKTSWRKNSMRVVILIGDMGNEQPDARGFTVDKVVEGLREYQCEFYAIQAQPESMAHPQIRLFNEQAREIAARLGMPERDVFSADGTDVSRAVIEGITTSNARAKALQKILDRLKDGSFVLDDAIMETLKEAGISLPSPDPGSGKATVRGFGEHGAILKQHFLDRLPAGIDPNVFLEKRIQHFGQAYGAQEIPGCSYPSFLTRILMERPELQLLTSAIGMVTNRGVNQTNIGKVWRDVAQRLVGEQDQEFTFDENVPLSEYMTMALGIPVRSELLKKTVVEIKRMPEAELSQQRQELEMLYNQMNNYDNDMRLDGKASERHWFLMNGREYAWVPVELMP